MKQAPEQEQHKALYRFNRHLESVQQAAKENLRQAQQSRLQNQPDNIVQYNKGDLVLHRKENTHRLQERKLAPPKQGPYIVVEQCASVDDTLSNTVICTDLYSDQEFRFHHKNLSIFAGTKEQAIDLQRIDKYESTIKSITDHRGNVDIRTQLEFEVNFDNGDVEWLNYTAVHTTQAFEVYVQPFTWGNAITKTLKDNVAEALSTNPQPKETLTQAISRLPQDKQPQLKDVRFYSLYAWNNKDWDIMEDEHTQFGLSLQGKEPLIQCNVMKVQNKMLEIQWPALPYRHKGKKVYWFTKDVDLYTYLKYTVKKPSSKQVIVTEAVLADSQFIRTLYENNNLQHVQVSDNKKSRGMSALNAIYSAPYMLVRPNPERSQELG